MSTRDQTSENQERELRQWAERLGSESLTVFAETASGARADRAALAALLAAAHRREFDMLLIWSLDRLSREGIGPMVNYIAQLRAADVRVMSYQESWRDTGGPVGDLLIAIFGWVAQQERQRIGERVRAGVARARASGKQLGRPRRVVDIEAVRARRAQGQGWRRIARALRVPMTTIRRSWKQCQTRLGGIEAASRAAGAGDGRGQAGHRRRPGLRNPSAVSYRSGSMRVRHDGGSPRVGVADRPAAARPDEPARTPAEVQAIRDPTS